MPLLFLVTLTVVSYDTFFLLLYYSKQSSRLVIDRISVPDGTSSYKLSRVAVFAFLFLLLP